MKALICELCGSNDLVKENGYFVCQNCGTKYTAEEAKKLMIDGPVEVQGNVKVDNSEMIKNYYVLARRARDNGNSVEGSKYYDLIRQEIPSDWEASFFASYFTSLQTNIAGIASAAKTIAITAKSTINLVKNSEYDDSERVNACATISEYVVKAGEILSNSTISHYQEYSSVTGARTEAEERITAIACDMLFGTGDYLEDCFSYDFDLYSQSACMLWKAGFNIYYKTRLRLGIKLFSIPESTCNAYSEKIKRFEPSYSCPISGYKEIFACYIATAVYGSYDCPQVWTLRRYRDSVLANTWYGRAFIHTYYAISPTVVKWFGGTEWFKKMWRAILDRMVAKLNTEGFEDTPYEDGNW